MARVPKIYWPKVSSRQTYAADYLLFKKGQGLAERTLDDMDYHLNRLKEAVLPRLDDETELRQCVMQFADSASAAPTTFNIRRRVLRGFFEWAKSEGIVKADIMRGIAMRRENDVPRSVDEDLIKKLLALPDTTTFAGLRDLALLVLTMDTGIRPKEAFGLLVDDLNLRSLEIVIRAPVAKTRMSRTLPISPITAEKLRRLTSVRHEQWPDSVPVFCTENGQPMDRFIWNARMRFYGKKLGARVRPYDLRHTFAVCYLRRGGNAFGLQRTLGHSTLVMTKRYVALTDRDLREQHKAASPLNGLMPGTRRVRKLKEAVAGS